MNFLRRLFSKIDRSGKCWLWTAGKHTRGYGVFFLHGKNVRVSRLIWEIFYGPIPIGLDVLHKCDNPPCCNPEHLFLGTKQDNALDAVSKGREAGQKLLISDVFKIRELYSTEKFTHADLGKLFHVNRRTIGDVVNHRTFR